MRILLHLVNPHSIYAGKSIFHGFKNAFKDLGHEFKTLTPNDDQKRVFDSYKPNIFMTSVNHLVFKNLNLDILKKAKRKGTKVFVSTPFWKSPLSRFRLNETQSLSENKDWVKLIKSGEFGDVYYSICEQGDQRMEGFTKSTGYTMHTILLAADKTVIFPEYSKKFESDISFIGTYLPGKKEIFDSQVKPLFSKYKVIIYGQDWTLINRVLGTIQKGGQYFNIPYLRSFLKQPLNLDDERRVYSSSLISINLHEDYQKDFLGDINERTFKIPLAGGFEIVDNVPSLKKYFKDGVDIIIAKDKKEWFEKIEYYLKYPQKRSKIIEAGRKKVLREHTYHQRVKQIIKLYEG